MGEILVRIAMIGGGYVGLVSAACFAEFGMHVSVVETNPQRLAALREGRIPIYEPGLDALVVSNAQAGRLVFGDDIATAVTGAQAVFIAVGTPPRNGDGAADLQYVHAAARQIAEALTDYAVVVTKSTVPVGSSRRIAQIIRKVRPDLDFDVASNPEFLREGSAIDDFMRPDRVIIGLDQAQPERASRAENVMRQVYRPLVQAAAPLVFTGLETAELAKYAANSFLAMKISFINEMADLCEKLGADVEDLARGMGLDARIGKRFLSPGPGYGGSCFPKDTLALSRIAQENQSGCRLVETTVQVNEARKAAMAGRIISACGGAVNGRTIAVLGLTFKPETDDMRESASIPILHRLAEAGAVLKAYDPVGMEAAKPLLPSDVLYCADAMDAADGADVLVVLTEWDIFRALSPEALARQMRTKVIVDLRNIFDPVAMRAAGFAYQSMGRP
ncbi:MAG: UDP-glucose/GDP-mannose dehydrogenase family protein [Acetobacter sp.]|uniref:UDP-glucose dehydrogenase family protein n=1 Tax=Acetobacter sp. TaxID=440 RepID=UPI0039E8F43C